MSPDVLLIVGILAAACLVLVVRGVIAVIGLLRLTKTKQCPWDGQEATMDTCTCA
jgi:membrane-associated PAP2 superfamily phosphatase